MDTICYNQVVVKQTENKKLAEAFMQHYRLKIQRHLLAPNNAGIKIKLSV